jgi:predicted DNA-binding transcriptional regulator AlpA
MVSEFRVLGFKDLVALGLFKNRMTLRRAILSGALEPPIELSPQRIAWPESAIKKYLASRPRRVPKRGRPRGPRQGLVARAAAKASATTAVPLQQQ